MKNSTVLAAFSVLVLMSASCSEPPAETTATPLRSAEDIDPRGAASALQSEIPQLMKSARIAGLSACFIHDFDIAWCGAFGVADVETGAGVNDTTGFQAASLSKPVFAYTVLRLVDQGVLELDKPLIDDIGLEKAREVHLGDGFDDDRVGSITARMVLTHTSGFPNWRGRNELAFLFDPEERFGYSGEGFGLLQQVVQEITGESLDDLVARHTFEPLGMAHSTYLPARVDLDNYAWPHDGAGNVEARPDDTEQRRQRARGHAAASLVTTASDFGRFLIALARGTGLDPATHAAMLEPYVETEAGTGVWWGLGTGLEKTPDGVGAWHWGDNFNSKAFYHMDPERGDGIVYFANSFNGLSIVGNLLEIVMPGEHPLLEGALLESYPALESAEFAFSSAVYSEGADAAVALVREEQKSGALMPEAEGLINRMGYWLMGQDRLDEAITLFELNVELYPEAWNVYDSLGEAQLRKGLRDQALANYKRSLEINPENPGARTILIEAGVSLD